MPKPLTVTRLLTATRRRISFEFGYHQEMDVISVAGTLGTFGFGILALYQWTALTAIKKAIRAHTQTAYNNFWSVGNEMEQLVKAANAPNAILEKAVVIQRSAAANAISMAARHETINFGRNYANIAPKYEQGWNPEQVPERRGLLERLFAKGSR